MIGKKLSLSLLTGALLMTACGNGGDTGGAASEEGPCVNAAQAKVAAQIDTLNIIIETSGSMKGFLPTRSGQTGFQQQVDDLLANAETEQSGIEKLRLYTAQDNIRTIGYDRFQSMLRQGLAQAGSSTAIPDMLRKIASQYTGSGQVSVFISDFIYSPPNERDRDYISNDIRRALAPLQEKGMAVAVYGFTSEFQGTYYPAGSKNGGKASPVSSCCDTEVPYYVWIMGPEPAVRLTAEKLFRNNNVPVAMQSGYERLKPAYGIIPGSGRSGSWYVGDAAGQTILVDDTQELRKGEVSFTVGLNLASLPTQFASEAYLQQHLEAQVRNGSAEVVSVVDSNEFSENEKLNSKDRQLLDCYTHLAKINIKSMEDRNSPISLQLTLPAQNPAWATEWTTDDDRNINEAGAKTFALEEILEGLRSLYPQEREAVFTLDLSIKKAK